MNIRIRKYRKKNTLDNTFNENLFAQRHQKKEDRQRNQSPNDISFSFWSVAQTIFPVA